MINSIQNPPMGREDVVRFRAKMAKHLRKDFSPKEREIFNVRNARAKANVKRILANCGGKNPILGY